MKLQSKCMKHNNKHVWQSMNCKADVCTRCSKIRFWERDFKNMKWIWPANDGSSEVLDYEPPCVLEISL